MRSAACLRQHPQLRNLIAALALACTLQSAAAVEANGTPLPLLPPVSVEQKTQLMKLSSAGDMKGLRALVQKLEREHDTSSMFTFGTYRAILLFSEDKSLQGLQELYKSLSLVKQQWENSPTAEHGGDYAFVLDGLAELLQKQAQTAQSMASRELAHAVALQALGPRNALTQWMLYKRMYLLLSNGHYPLAQQLMKELEQTLPQPLNRCRESICISLRFQQANLAGLLGNPALAMRLSKDLMPDLKTDPGHAVWNIYHLVQLSWRLKRSKDLQHWCAQALQMASKPQFANLDGMNRVTAKCLHEQNPGAERFDSLISQEIKLRGAGGDGSAYLLLQKAESLGEHSRPLEAAEAAAQTWAIGIAKNMDYWQWSGLYTMAMALAEAKWIPEAIYHGKQAVNVQQRMLANAKGLTSAQRDAVLRQGNGIYEELADWLLQNQRFSEAEQTLTLAREQSYHQLVRSAQPSQRALELTPSEQTHHASTLPVQSHLNKAWQERENDRTGLVLALAQGAKALNARMARPSASQAVFTHLTKLVPGETEVRYLPAQEHVYVVIRRGDQPDQHLRLPIAQKQLTQDIAQLRRELQQRDSQPQIQAQKLYRQLWKPLQQWLPAPQPQAAAGNAPEVRVHLEGALRYLPMAALHDGKHWLGESYALPQDTGVKAEPMAQETVARDGWSLQGSSRAAATLPALPKVREEIEGLALLAGSSGIAHDEQQDDAFTADSLRTALQSRKVVHLASHFQLLPGNGQGSGLYLGNGQLLTLGELMDPSFRFDGLELLTLSACETAVPSGPAEQGLPVDSLAWLAQARGTQYVLASLWAVADEGTQQFMKAFYTALASPLSHAQAVRAAQLAMLHSHANASSRNASNQRGLSTPLPTTSKQNAGLAHPYYWSAFVLLAGSH